MYAPHSDFQFSNQQALDSADYDSAVSWDGSPLVRTEQLRLLSLFTPASGLEARDLLRDAGGRERFYWSEPATSLDNMTIAGVGIAAEVRVPPILDTDDLSAILPGLRFDEVARQAKLLFEEAIVLSVNPENGQTNILEGFEHPARPRLFGGFAFQDDFVPDNTWSVFSPAHFVLPHFQYVRTGQEIYLTINTLVASNEDFSETLEGLHAALLTKVAAVSHVATPHIPHMDLRYPMSPKMWREIVTRATGAIHEGQLEKVVLSRVCEVRASQPIDPVSALEYLDARYDDSYRFLFEPVPHHAFFGATPELLIRKDGSHLQTMALAGSMARGKTTDEDELLATQLLSSIKDRHEHRLVVEAIRNDLDEFTSQLIFSTHPGVLRLRNIQHLVTLIEGRLLNNETSVLSLLRRLHPTPAMGGVPASQALAFLRREEFVPRGWYAAPIGWLDAHNNGIFAVAIRSAVTQHTRAWLYAGAGIVGDSLPEREWAETALKFRPMLGAFGVEEIV